MRAKRRQELKTNDLAQWLDEMSVSFKDWSAYVIGGIAVVVLIWVGVYYLRNAKAEALGKSYVELQQSTTLVSGGIRKTDEEIRQSVQKIGDLANESGDVSFKLEALIDRADLATAAAQTGGADYAKLLDDARASYEEIIKNHQDHPLHYGRALAGMYQIEAQAFARDQDPQHKATAAGYLEKIRDDARLARTPLNNMAVDTLNNLDRIFSAMKFPNKPPRPATAPAEQPDGAAPSVSNIKLKPIAPQPPAEPEKPAEGQPQAPEASAAPATSSAPPPATEPETATPAPQPAAPPAAPSAAPSAAPADTGSNG